MNPFRAAYDYSALTDILRRLPPEMPLYQRNYLDMLHEHGRRHPQIWQDGDSQH